MFPLLRREEGGREGGEGMTGGWEGEREEGRGGGGGGGSEYGLGKCKRVKASLSCRYPFVMGKEIRRSVSFGF